MTGRARSARTLDRPRVRDDVVAAALSAKARGNFGGSRCRREVGGGHNVGHNVGRREPPLRGRRGRRRSARVVNDCGDATDDQAVDNGVVVATVAISDAVEFDYCPNGGLAEVEVSVDFTVRRCEPRRCPRRGRRRAAAVRKAEEAVISAGGVRAHDGGRRPRGRRRRGLLACFCFERARRAQDRRVDEIIWEADEINWKADAAAASPPRSSRSGEDRNKLN